MKGRAVLTALILAAVGCAARVTARTVIAPDGQPTTLIECLDESRCIVEAKRVCPRGYLVLDARAREGDVVMSNGIAAQTYRGQMLIRCE